MRLAGPPARPDVSWGSSENAAAMAAGFVYVFLTSRMCCTISRQFLPAGSCGFVRGRYLRENKEAFMSAVLQVL